VAVDDLLTERLLRIVDEGRRTATYKLALLLGLIDGAALAPGQSEIPTRALAERVVELYYPQTRAYVANDGVARELRQITMKKSAPLQAMLRLRLHGDAARCRSIGEVRSRLPDEYSRGVDRVEETFVRYPIPLLQVVGRHSLPFLYEVDWPEGTPVATLRRQGRDRVRFLEGVADRLVVLGPLLRPLIELHWTRDVARWTRVHTEEDRLRAHLFGADRVSFPPVLREGLRDLQAGRCFYCGNPLTQRAQVDHFLAWSRWPNDAIENLVLADRCNGDKSDHLAALEHIDQWADRSRHQSGLLAAIAGDARWPSDARRSAALVRSTYGHIAAGTPLWVVGNDFVEAAGPTEVAV
jgi:5-methylcytosine-specific restriction endonuclease McrA